MKRILLVFSALISWNVVSAQLYINEVCPANGDIIHDDYFNFPGWIELYNNGATSLNVGGYYLSDNADMTKWTIPSGTSIPSKGYLLIWCDDLNLKLHTNFSLDTDGEKITLSSPGLAQIDVVEYPKMFTNISYGRTTNGASTWSFLSSPSPAGSNVSTAATVRLDAPTASVKSGRYSGIQSVTLTHPDQSAEIRYTLDGSEPNSTSSKYAGPVSISSTKTLKAKAFSSNFLPSKTEVKTYFINEHTFTLPTVSLSIQPSYLWDNIIGIYTDGTNGTIGNCQNVPKNWNQDWDRHADFEYFDITGNKTFDQSVDIRISGGCSRANSQKSFAVRARDKYGKGSLDEHFFKSKDIKEFGSVFLRNSGNDFNVTSFRDALMQTLTVSQMDVDYLAYQPSTLYINGQYWGIQSLREKIDGDYIESNYGIKKDDIDLLETYENAIEGTNEAYVNYKNTLQGMNPSDPATFKFIDDHIDVQEYINYLVSEIYYGNTDWPGNNQKFWRQRSTNGKFRWIMWDLDFGFALYPDWSSNYNHPTLQFATDPNSGVDWPNPSWSTLHIRLVLQNPEFRTRFIQTLTTAMSTTFKPERVIKYINAFQEPLKAEMPYHKQRWGGVMSDWEADVQRLRDVAVLRNNFMQQHTADFFDLTERVNISVSASPQNSGTFKLNGIQADEPLSNGSYFKGLPYKIEAAPHAGFVFKNWKITKRQSTSGTSITKGDTWKYFDQGMSPGSDWNTSAFNDNTWSSGPAQLGYGNDGEKTTVNYGADAGNKFITTYFRKTFTIDNTDGMQDVNAAVLFDDGVVVYVNGVEVYRNNMPDGAIDFNTLASTTIPVENIFNSFTISKDLFVAGTNTVAVEIHQASPTSSDIGFDFELKTTAIGDVVESSSSTSVLIDTAYSDVVVQAFYEALPSVSGIVINEFSAAKSTVKDDFNEVEDWIELYNKSAVPVDVAGLFITDDLNNKTKYKIPSGHAKTIIQPGSYLLLWADDQVNQGVTHLSFKLSADGEAVGLYQVVGQDTLSLDAFRYASQEDNSSWARIPNATGSFTKTVKLTPGSSNILITGTDEDLTPLVIYPNPAGDHISIHTPGKINEVLIYDLMGRMVKSFTDVKNDSLLSLENLQQGLFVVKVRLENQEAVVKIIKQ
ncbi:MAG TPA: CotH kinase family protein [Cyclobacteriaceae bacterium]